MDRPPNQSLDPFVAQLAEERFTIDEHRQPRKSSPLTWLVAGTLWGAIMSVLFMNYVQPAFATNTQTLASRPAPEFTLPSADGEQITFDGQGKHLIVLSAVGCQDCRDRVPLDRTLAKMAQLRGVMVTNLLVFANERSATAFVSHYEPLADHFLVDNGHVAVNLYRGSDDHCWIYVKDGRIIWQGPGDLNLIAEQILQ